MNGSRKTKNVEQSVELWDWHPVAFNHRTKNCSMFEILPGEGNKEKTQPKKTSAKIEGKEIMNENIAWCWWSRWFKKKMTEWNFMCAHGSCEGNDWDLVQWMDEGLALMEKDEGEGLWLEGGWMSDGEWMWSDSLGEEEGEWSLSQLMWDEKFVRSSSGVWGVLVERVCCPSEGLAL
jgi:hypothetical protein